MNIVARNRDESSDLVRAYLRDIRPCEPLTREEEALLARRGRAGDEEAMNRLATANLRFVVMIARQYFGLGLSFMELVSEGNSGLLEAVRRFDERRGFKFISYAVWWIRRAILRALDTAKMVTTPPASRIADSRKLHKKQDELTQELGREPWLSEVAERVEMRVDRARRALVATNHDVSLDEPIFEDEGGSFSTLLVAEGTDIQCAFEASVAAQRLEHAVSTLDEREGRIIRRYYGLGDEEPMSLDQIGGILGVTRERVRQLRNRALEKLRARLGTQLVRHRAAPSGS